MTQRSTQSAAQMAMELLELAPTLLRRLTNDMPAEGELTEETGWREVQELRATPGQLTLMRILVERGRCTMQELAEQLAVTPSTVTAMVKRLLTQGYIERERDDNDWRCVWVKPTEIGRKATTLFFSARMSMLNRRLEYLSDDELEHIRAVLPVLKHLLEV